MLDILDSVKDNSIIYIFRYFLAQINKMFAVIVVPISKQSYNLQQRRAKID
ncbi:MAG: hypothetical protein QFX12_01425 [Rickettsia africae]|uniref:Uncharacterized protein n=2 Tax=spotted fever group TaxID=114277 RepID=Q92H14_RICCN|nr:hypothetical protein [Rickettsia africae]AAL03496.1 unknown [Rickettsia conorii str. Malish 7]AFC75136.1 hypothetical protein MC1_05335 [Rickettsia parkeri str. Portsmouth]KJV95474.1 hypothetical protein RPAAT24_0332 [Rickettsia parkeri str. AT\